MFSSSVLVILMLLLLVFVQYCWPVITASPLKSGFPFLFMWNAPTELCKSHFGIELDLSHFKVKICLGWPYWTLRSGDHSGSVTGVARMSTGSSLYRSSCRRICLCHIKSTSLSSDDI
ncbi:hypothetical protein AOLI_G00182460 [Acnodon oligacanthus]